MSRPPRAAARTAALFDTFWSEQVVVAGLRPGWTAERCCAWNAVAIVDPAAVEVAAGRAKAVIGDHAGRVGPEAFWRVPVATGALLFRDGADVLRLVVGHDRRQVDFVGVSVASTVLRAAAGSPLTGVAELSFAFDPDLQIVSALSEIEGAAPLLRLRLSARLWTEGQVDLEPDEGAFSERFSV